VKGFDGKKVKVKKIKTGWQHLRSIAKLLNTLFTNVLLASVKNIGLLIFKLILLRLPSATAP
jgi:hypothetical protein